MKISKMTLDDLVSIKDALQEEFDDFWNFNIIKQELLNTNTRYLVAKINNKICGFAGILINLDQVEVMNIVVKKDERRQGIGIALLEELINLAKKTNLPILTLEVNSNNEPAKKLYEKIGFEIVRN